MRFALCAYMSQGRDINLDILRVQGYRFFCNKLWNATKFALMYLSGGDKFTPVTSLTGDENVIDLWILSRLANTINICNSGFESYEFASATNACYNFWLYEVCDNYLECLKPIFQNEAKDSKKIQSARRTLYTCLELGLKLISPFMPFISEELFQRLPRADDKIPSICVSQYPDEKSSPWRNEDIEKEFELVQRAVKMIRSVRSDYNLQNKTKTEAFVVCSDNLIQNTLEKFSSSLSTLSYSTIHFEETPPSGCAILTISDKCEIHLVLKGLIEPEKEISKLEKKMEFLKQSILKLNQAMQDAGYMIKVPEEVRTSNSEKLTQSEGELERVTKAIETLKLL